MSRSSTPLARADAGVAPALLTYATRPGSPDCLPSASRRRPPGHLGDRTLTPDKVARGGAGNRE
jgi:hypothetical protein